MNNQIQIKTAVISVSDKTGLAELCTALASQDVKLYSTGGTEKFLHEHGFDVTSVSELTHFPEMMDGRVKTLHPVIHGGLLFRRDIPEHVQQASANNTPPIDLLVVNLYPFEATVAKTGVTHEEIIENIDIGGPAMLRSAGKNYEAVVLLTSPIQYAKFIKEFTHADGSISLQSRLELAGEAFEHVAIYDRAIANYFSGSKKNVLRYGENPQQHATVQGKEIDVLYHQIWGKELSYNNYLDSSAALQLIGEFLDSEKSVVGIIKHTNPCGIAEGTSVLEAFERAYATDTESPFGGIIVMNRPCSEELALRINEFFSEVILAPSFDEKALTILQKKKDRRLLCFDRKTLFELSNRGSEIRTILGGTLEQEIDTKLSADSEMKSVTSRRASTEEQSGLLFAWKICKHVKSNAIVYAVTENGFARTIGIGCGQTSRVASSRLAVANAKRFGHSTAGSLVASDAFFPFADGLLEAADAGAIAVIEPGGSVRDNEVIQVASDRNISLVMTGMRHFRH
ncbi:MAG: bifunctional phosphoribosylaminoimidazolecarboxamide formyltransferase/IMP cyclohydrolase [bacterium]